MQKQLEELVGHIEASTLTDAEKADVYAAISNALQATVWPVLMKHLPQDRVKELSDNPESLTPQGYEGMLNESVKDGAAIGEIQKAMEKAVVEIADLLKTEYAIG